MSDLNINDINSTGAELFADSESFLQELSDDEMMNIGGGRVVAITNTLVENCCRTTSNFTDTLAATCGTSPQVQV
jgi:hypothetical protein